MVNVLTKGLNAFRWNRAIKSFQRQKLEESYATVCDILSREPDSLPAKLLRAMIELSRGEMESAFESFKEVFVDTSTKRSANAKYLNIYSEIFILKMSEENPDISLLYTQSQSLSCTPALRRWFPLIP